MIKKIHQIKNFGKFDALTQTAGVFAHGDNNRNIIYGFNGSGKTTLSNVLSLFSPHGFVDEEQKAEIVTDLSRDGVAPTIEFVTNTGSTFKYGSNRDEKRIYVFNENFISTHVYDGASSNLKKFSNIVTELGSKETKQLSEKLVSEQQRLDDLVKRHAAMQASLKLINSAHTKRFASSLTDMGKKLTVPSNIEVSPDSGKSLLQISNDIDELAQDYQLSKQQSTIVNDLTTLRSISFTKLEVPIAESDELLSKTISKVDGELLKEKIELLKESFAGTPAEESVERWFRFGKQILDKLAETHPEGHTCPTCNQSIDNGSIDNLLKTYSDYFSDDYDKHLRQINDVVTRLSELKNVVINNSLTLATLSGVVLRYAQIMKEYASLPILEEALVLEVLTNTIGKLEKKISGILAESVSVVESDSDDVRDAGTVINDYNASITSLNEAVAALIADLAKKSLSPNDIEKKLRAQYQQLTLAEFNSDGKQIDEYKQAVADIEILRGTSIPETRGKLAEAVKNLKVESKAVGKYLKRLGVEHFTIDINDEDSVSSVKIVFPSTNSTRHNFKNTLSTGEKTALAFAYFISKVENELTPSDFQKATFVIDDPISSLDEDRVYKTAYLVHDFFGPAEQLFVLSHNFLFLKNFNSFHSGKNERFFLNGEKLSELPVEMNNFESPYFYMLQTMHHFVDSAGGVTYEECRKYMPNYVRRVLETFINFKFCYVSRAAFSMGLKDFIENEIKKLTLPETSVGNLNKDNLKEKLSQVNRICDSYSHGSLNNMAESNYVSEADLRELVRDALDAMEYFDVNHNFKVSGAALPTPAVTALQVAA